MIEPQWLDRLAVEILHHDQIVEHGGLTGIRDEALLESALARPRNQWLYDRTRDLADLAAAYAFGLSRNHPFVDGNKRIAFICLAVFLELNGSSLEADDADVVSTMRQLAAHDLGEADLAAWVRVKIQRSEM